MRIAVLCATDRGLRALRCVRELAPEAELLVVTYPETPHEPPFVHAIQDFAADQDSQFFLQTDVSKGPAAEWLTKGFDLLFCFSWRYMVPPRIYQSARLGSYVIHDSLLPKYRGFSPAVWALINGEKEVGVTLFEMTEEVDAGRIVGQEAIPVEETDDIGTIREKGTVAVLKLLKRHYHEIAEGTAQLMAQNESEATYTCKWIPSDAKIDWTQSRESILNLIRATAAPYPGAFCFLDRNLIRVWKAELPTTDRQYVSLVPGAVCSIAPDGSVGILTLDGELVIQEVSKNDGPRVPAAEVIRSLAARLR